MAKTSLFSGLLALAFFAYAQHQGWNLFDQEATPSTRSASGGRSVYHK